MDPLHFESPYSNPPNGAPSKKQRSVKWERRWQSPFRTAAIAFMIGISPVGFVVPYIFFSALGLCRGALGSGVSCHLPLASGYFETMAVLFEVSCFMFGLCLVWGLAAFVIWIGFAVYFLRGIYLLFRPA